MIHRARSALGRSVVLAVRHPALAVWTQLALTCALLLVGAAGLAAGAIDHWADAHPGRGGRMVVYLGDGVSPARAAQLTADLRRLQGVERAELIAADESARRLTRALGGDAALLDGVDVASLPASVEVTLAPGVRDVLAISPTLRALRNAPGVADVVVPAADPASPAGADDPLADVLHVARGLAWLAAAVLTGLALVIVLAAVRLRLERSPREAAVLHLLGASPAFTAVPSALAGAWQGGLAGGLAALALAALVRAADPVAAIVDPSPLAFAALIALGAGVGLVGGGLAGLARLGRAR
jgi:cell division protein FtsX